MDQDSLATLRLQMSRQRFLAPTMNSRNNLQNQNIINQKQDYDEQYQDNYNQISYQPTAAPRILPPPQTTRQNLTPKQQQNNNNNDNNQITAQKQQNVKNQVISREQNQQQNQFQNPNYVSQIPIKIAEENQIYQFEQKPASQYGERTTVFYLKDSENEPVKLSQKNTNKLQSNEKKSNNQIDQPAENLQRVKKNQPQKFPDVQQEQYQYSYQQSYDQYYNQEYKGISTYIENRRPNQVSAPNQIIQQQNNNQQQNLNQRPATYAENQLYNYQREDTVQYQLQQRLQSQLDDMTEQEKDVFSREMYQVGLQAPGQKFLKQEETPQQKQKIDVGETTVAEEVREPPIPNEQNQQSVQEPSSEDQKEVQQNQQLNRSSMGPQTPIKTMQLKPNVNETNTLQIQLLLEIVYPDENSTEEQESLRDRDFAIIEVEREKKTKKPEESAVKIERDLVQEPHKLDDSRAKHNGLKDILYITWQIYICLIVFYCLF